MGAAEGVCGWRTKSKSVKTVKTVKPITSNFRDNLIVSGRKRRKASLDPFVWQESLLPSRKDFEARVAGNRSWRLLPLTSSLIFVFLLLTARLFNLQVIDGRRHFVEGEGNRILSQIVRPERGVIYDRNSEILARNQPGFSVLFNLADNQAAIKSLTLDKTIANLAAVLGISPEEIKQKIAKAKAAGQTEATVKSAVEREKVLKIEANKESFPGVTTVVDPFREYLDGEVFAHLLGFVGEASLEDLKSLADLGVRSGDTVGKTNVERVFEPLLKGVSGERLLEVDAFGHKFAEVSRRESTTGRDLTLSIDARLQKTSFEALQRGVEESSALGGAAVVQEVNTGKILSLVSLPTFNPNLFSKGISESDYQALLSDPARPMFNRALSGSYPPGSTFKIITATAALSEKIITPRTEIDDKGSIAIGSFVYHGWAPEGLGLVNLVTAIAKSSDIYFYTVGGGYGGQAGVGVENLAHWSRLFGLGSETQIDLTAEATGLVPDPVWKLENRDEPWYIGNTYHMSIGQGDLLVTPLQLNNLMAAVANGGTLYRPQLLKGAESEVLRQDFVLGDVLDWVKKGLRAACQPGGTAYPFFDFKVPVAGKTGTSETGKKDKTHAWFTAFAPFDHPEVAVTVFLEEGGEGSHNAAPVVRRILEHYFSEK